MTEQQHQQQPMISPSNSTRRSVKTTIDDQSKQQHNDDQSKRQSMISQSNSITTISQTKTMAIDDQSTLWGIALL